MKHHHPLLLAALWSVFSSGALAEEATLEEIQVKASSDTPGLNLKKKNSTASRLGLSAQETPASVESLDAQTIRSRGDISIREAVTRTTGITDVSTLGNGQAFSSRGFTGTNSVAQAEDGVRLMTGAGTQTYPSDSWGYERIEVLRGPASVLFGDGSAGGIINSVRKQASRETSVEALVGAGSYGAYRAALGGSGALGEIGAFRIDASLLGGDGYISRGDYESKKLMSSWLFTPTDSLRIGFTLDHAKDEPTANLGSPLRNGKISHSLRKDNYNVNDNIMAFEDTRARAKLEWDINDSWKLKNEAYWFKSEREWRNAESFTLNAVANTVSRGSFLAITHEQKQIGNRLEISNNTTLWGHQNRFAAGWEISRTDFRQASNAGNNVSDVIPVGGNTGVFRSTSALLPNYDADFTQQAAFLENAWSATEQLKLVVGLRRDYMDTERKDYRGAPNSDKQFIADTWRLGAVYDLDQDTSLYAQTSRGTDPITTLLGLNLANSEFDLTRARQAEIGIKQVLQRIHGEWTLAAYHIAKDNIITRDPIIQSLSVQGGKQSSRGLEFATTLYPLEHWRLDFNAALLDARYDELREGGTAISRAGNTPVNVPEKVANAWLTYQATQWEAGVGARYVGKRYANNANDITLAGYTVYDASAAWHVNQKMTLRANLRNITDKFYAAIAYGNNQQIIGAPRQIELTAEFRY